MQTITTIGLDIAKSVFQVHGVDAAGEVIIRRQLKRRSVLAFYLRPMINECGPVNFLRQVCRKPASCIHA
jgi:transposase